MKDRILWEYLAELPEHDAAWREWRHCLADWHNFDTFHVHYLKLEEGRAKLIMCTTPCGHDCPRQVVEYSPSEIFAVCEHGKTAPVQLTFKDILIYSLRLKAFHQALCIALQIEQSSGGKWIEYGNACHLGDYSGMPVYLTYRTVPVALTATINSLCLLHQDSFILMTPTGRGLAVKAQQLLARSNAALLCMESELSLQPDGSFKSLRSISECMQAFKHCGSQAAQRKLLPLEAYKYLVYKDL